MKVKLPDNEWEEVGPLVQIGSYTLHELGAGTFFTAQSGVQFFFSKEDLDKLSGDEPQSGSLRF